MKFKLEPILKLRSQNEESQKRILGKLRIELATAKRQYELLLQEKQSLLMNYAQAMLGTIQQDELACMRQYIGVVDNRIKKQLEQVKALQTQVEQQQMVLQEAMKERKIMENLKEVHLERWFEEEKRQEQCITDQLVSYQYSVAERSD